MMYFMIAKKKIKPASHQMEEKNLPEIKKTNYLILKKRKKAS